MLITTINRKIFISFIIVISAIFMLSCTPMWTFEFQLDEKFEDDKLKGWIIKSNISSARNITAEIAAIAYLNDYEMSLDFELPAKKKRIAYYDINIDSIKITMQNHQDTIFLKKKNFFYSFKSNKQILKSISFYPKGLLNPVRNRHYSLHIPDDVDSLILQFDVILREAEYFSYIRKYFAGVEANMEEDSLRIIEGKEPIIVPIELRLHRYVSKR